MVTDDLPTESACPLCRNELVELRENKSGNPYFTCRTFDSTVNLRPGDNDTAQTLLTELSEADLSDDARNVLSDGESTVTTEEASDDEPEADTQTLSDLLSEGDDDE